MDIDGPKKMFNFLIDILFRPVHEISETNFKHVISFLAQIYWKSYYKTIFLFINILF